MGLLTSAVDKVSSYTTNSDIKQTFAVMKNELIKFLRGKKIYIYLAIIAIFLALDISLSLLLEDAHGNRTNILDNGGDLGRMILGDLPLILTIMATIFTASAISAEFEERTALILLTKPIRRVSIIAGKFLASFCVGFATLLFYYILAIILILIGKGELDGNIPASFGMYLFVIVMFISITLVISAFAKKSSTATLLTLFVLLILPIIVESLLAFRDIDTWFMFGSLRESAANVLKGGGEPLRDIIAMLVWSIAGTAGSIALFKRRQF